jgi:hypothetical protein
LFEWSPGVAIIDDAPATILHDGPLDIAPCKDKGAPEALFGQEPNPTEPIEDEDPNKHENDSENANQPDIYANDKNKAEPYIEDDRSADEDTVNAEPEWDESNEDSSKPSMDTEVLPSKDSSSKDESSQEEPDTDDTPHDDPNDDTPARRPRHNLRQNRSRDYIHRLGHIMDDPASTKSYDDTQFFQHSEADDKPTTLQDAVEDMQRTGDNHDILKGITGLIMTQMLAKAGIKKHGQVAIDEFFKEFTQLHDLRVFLAQDATTLTTLEKQGALRAISVVKEKRCGCIKGRTVADGRPQRKLYTKEETASPTVSTDALMLSLLIDAHERRDVAVANVTGAYLHADMEDFTLLKMEGESVDIMCNESESQSYESIEESVLSVDARTNKNK